MNHYFLLSVIFVSLSVLHNHMTTVQISQSTTVKRFRRKVWTFEH